MKPAEIKTAIRLQNLGHAYVPGAWIFRGYEATIASGKIVALLGINGCGKSTLLDLIMGPLKPTEGSVDVNGEVAYVPQFFNAMFNYTVLDIVTMGRAKKISLFAQPSSHDIELCMNALERFGMEDFALRPFMELSGGQRQLVIFARALVSEASIVILDEPTSALDLRHQNVVLDWIVSLSCENALTILFSTHHVHHAYAIADYALLMLGDGTALYGGAHNVLSERNLSALYEVPIQRAELRHDSRSVATLVPVYFGKQRKILGSVPSECKHNSGINYRSVNI
jgi:iron complex transport system ATP-binding protein